MKKIALLTVLLLACATAVATFTQSTDAVIRARAVIDGKGGVVQNGIVTVRNGKIVSVGTTGTPSVDLGNLTLMPGFIDVHVHIGWHFDEDGRYHAGPEPAERAALYGAENAYVTLI